MRSVWGGELTTGDEEAAQAEAVPRLVPLQGRKMDIVDRLLLYSPGQGFLPLNAAAIRSFICSGVTSSMWQAIDQWCPYGSTSLPNRSPQNMSAKGMVTFA